MKFNEVLFFVVLILVIFTGSGKADLLESLSSLVGKIAEKVLDASKEAADDVPSMPMDEKM
ncbi:hypothetical protein FF38_02144 [Lucilia cuprina]|uniref:Uncharacterized protein n=1 Tax=Lucilia cuprina TaxID=7375 RepID=A0A0L0BZE4_LUCCU|nr:hypothetical protein CVS40_8871 [Lucilia cuprina]KNC25452.1 hypothetical protein FF38_02144 [Lucilia cuprina]